MKRPATLLLTGAIVAAGAAWYPTHAAAALCGQPSVSGVTVGGAPKQFAPAGSAVTITGSNFMALACNTTANVGGVSLAQNQMTVTSNGLTFTAQAGMHGGIQVTETDITNSQNKSNSNIAFYTTPTVSGVSDSAPSAAQGVTVGGSGFNFTLPSGEEQLTAKYLFGSTTCTTATAGLASDSAIALSAPGRYCDGNVALTIAAPGDLGNPSGSMINVYDGQPGHVDVKPTSNAVSSTPVVAGGTVTVTGSGFGTAGSATLGGAAVTPAWSDSSVGFTVPDTAVNNSAVALTRSTGDNAAIPVSGNVMVNARVDSISPTSAKPGDTVTVAGGGFGTNAGTVSLASANATVSSWSPTSIVFTVPAAGQSGQLTIAPVDTGAPASVPSLTVTHPVSFTPGGTPGGAGSGSNAKPLTQAQVEQVTQALSAPPPPLPPAVIGGAPPAIPPSHPTNGSIALSLKPASTSAKPGKAVPFTVTLLAYGRPVGNAPVQMVVAYEPGPDAGITPMSGITDAKGQFHGTVHLSKKPGEMIILARTGEFSAEVQLIGSTTTAAAVGTGQGPGALQSSLPYAIVALAALLLIVGIGLRVGLWVGSTDSVRAALVRERFNRMARRARGRFGIVARATRGFLVAHVVQRPPASPSGRDVQARGNAASEVSVPAEGEPAVLLSALGRDTAPDQTKERISVGP